jgi:hypothetical protein
MSLKVLILLNSVGQSATLIRWKSPVQAWQWVPYNVAQWKSIRLITGR